ncbi:transcriptional regulator, LysR family protein [Rhizobium etli CNPAF512]|nr:transcriptional regulator, LysR family protein [Rhizobium etli CNPAF512]
MIGGDRRDVRIVRRERCTICGFQAAGFDFRDRLALVALDQHEIAGGETGEDLLERGLRRAAQLVHDGVTGAGDDRDLMCAGLAMAVTVGADLVDIEIMMGMLDRRDLVAAAGEFRHQPDGEPRFAGVLPAGDAEDFRCGHVRRASSQRCASTRSSGVLMLKKGSSRLARVGCSGKATSVTSCRKRKSRTRRFSSVAIQDSRSAASVTGQRPKTGWLRPSEAAMAICDGRSSVAASRATRSAGKKGQSTETVATWVTEGIAAAWVIAA